MPRPSISGHPLSPKALAWVKSLLETCKTQHISCRAGLPRLPKRILAIGSSARGSFHVKLLEDHQQYAPYAALSHCWGKRQTCITTLANLDEHKRDIPWHSIPKTFQDAILFALKLGIGYLWIDSLCIIQDDIVDWDAESSKMADIYKNSYLTVAATASSSASKGCYPEEVELEEVTEICIPQDLTGSCQIAIREQHRHWNTVSQNVFNRLYPLLSRAWAFQERILFPSVLHFCSSELFWECREAMHCECGELSDETGPGGEYHQVLGMNHNETPLAFPETTNPIALALISKEAAYNQYSTEHDTILQEDLRDGHPVSLERRVEIYGLAKLRDQALKEVEILRRPYHDFQDMLDGLELEKETSELSRHYRRLVERYSALQVTKTTDRLPALSGLCKRVAHLRGEYIAGLWLDSLWFDLLWRVDVLQPPSGCVEQLRSRRPSWPWTSVDSPVKYWDDIKSLSLGSLPVDPTDDAALSINRPALKVRRLRRRPQDIRYNVQLTGKNPFGEVSSATLELETYCRTALLRYAHHSQLDTAGGSSDPLRYKLEAGEANIQFFADYPLGSGGQNMVLDCTVVTLLLIHPQVALVLKPSTHLTDNGSILKLSSNPVKHIMRKIGKRNDSEVKLWERIGIARVSDALLDLYKVDWMEGATSMAFSLI